MHPDGVAILRDFEDGLGEPLVGGGVVFATWQSLSQALKRGEPLAQRFGLVIVDEAHHAPAHVYRNLLESLLPNFLVGMTATPWRGDELTLDDVFGEPAFTMDIVEGMQRANQQWAPSASLAAPLKVTCSTVRQSPDNAVRSSIRSWRTANAWASRRKSTSTTCSAGCLG